MTKITAINGIEHYKTIIRSDVHEIVIDEPADAGGRNAGMQPGQMLSASVASCTAITMRMYAERKNWPLSETIIDAELNHDRENPQLKLEITIIGDLDHDQRKRLFDIGMRCPIHKMLERSVTISGLLKD